MVDYIREKRELMYCQTLCLQIKWNTKRHGKRKAVNAKAKKWAMGALPAATSNRAYYSYEEYGRSTKAFYGSTASKGCGGVNAILPACCYGAFLAGKFYGRFFKRSAANNCQLSLVGFGIIL